MNIPNFANNANTRSEAQKRALERQNEEFKGFIRFTLGMLILMPILIILVGIVEGW